MNNKRNRLPVLALVFVMLLSFCVPAFAETTTVASPFVGLDADTNMVKISGVHPLGAGASVTVSAKISGSTFYKREISAGLGGEFSLTYKMDAGTEEIEGDTSGTYNVTIGGAGLNSTVKQYQFINKKDGKTIVEAANAAETAQAMKETIATYNGILNLDLSAEGAFGKLSADGKTAVYAALATENNFGSAIKIINMFNSAVAIQTMNEADKEAAEALVMQYKDILSFNMGVSSNYAKIQTAAGKARLYKAMVGGNLPLESVEKVAREFERAVYTQLFNEINTENRDKFIVYVEECNTAGYEQFTLTKYNSSYLSDTDRADIIVELVELVSKKPFSNIEEVKEAFEKEASKKLESNLSSTDSSGSSSSSGEKVVISNTKNDSQSVNSDNSQAVSQPIFSDIAEAAWSAEAVNYLAGKQIVNGVGDGKFNPNGLVKREEFVKIMMLALKIPSEETEKRFSDVAEGAWYYKYIQDAYALNIISGIDFDVFGVGQNISREQMCTMLYRAMKFMDINISDNEKVMTFSDKGEISDYAYEAVEALYRAGVVNGVSETQFNPKATATRAMASQMVYQLMKRGNLS